ncbi:MAG: hypothetical protein ACFFAU_08950 [Candidatus Hodarchaeota archaeon]
MKSRLSIMTILILVLSLLAIMNQGSLDFYQKNLKERSLFPLDSYPVSPLRKNFKPLITGIISPTNSPPRTNINTIIDEPALITSGTELVIQNRFTIPGFGSWAIIAQEIQVYLYEQTDLDAIDPNNPDSSHLINTTSRGTSAIQPVTNATDPSKVPAISVDPSNGWVNFNITLGTMDYLSSQYGIVAGDTVSIYQYYPGGSANVTAEIESVSPFWITDNFTLSGFASISVNTEFQNTESGDSTFRQGGNASAILYASSQEGPLENVTIKCSLYASDDSLILNNTNGIYYTISDTKTKADGLANLAVYTIYPNVNEDDYYFVINASFNETSYFTQNYVTGDPNSNYDTTTVNFTINNEMDTVDIVFISATNQNPPDYLDPPNANITTVTYQLQAQYVYTSGIYYPENIPVNATLVNPPTDGVTISSDYPTNGSSDWYLTDSSGFIKFNITAEFPILYKDIIQYIKVEADVLNDLTPQYPPTSGSNNQPHRFMRNSTNTGGIDTESHSISINPDFWIGEIVPISPPSPIRPGVYIQLEFEVRSSQNPSDYFPGVPVEFSLSSSIPGVSLDHNPGGSYTLFRDNYYKTDSSGRIKIGVDSTYLTTPEYFQTITLDITVDFENDSQARWIGETNVIIEYGWTDSLVNFNKTWLNDQYTELSIDPQFTKYQIVLETTNETGDTTIRAGDTLELTFKVEPQGGGAGLQNVPVYFKLIGSNPGVSWDYIIDNKTDGSGLITIRLVTTYPTTPKILAIKLNATADFENDTSPNVWLVGEKSLNSNFYSNSSYSDTEEIINVLPQYFDGDIHLLPAVDNPNATLIGQTQAIEISFRLKLIYSGGGELTPLPIINGVNISITINNTAPSDWNMTILPAEFRNSVNGIATFTILTTNNTPEAIYFINATAHFGEAQSLTYNVTADSHPTLPSSTLSGIWVNGSHPNNNISFLTEEFRVKNIDQIKVQIASVSDLSHPDEGLNLTTGFYEIYRSTTFLNISGSYKDQFQNPRVSVDVIISFNYTDLANLTNTYDLGTVKTSSITGLEGTFWINVSIPFSIPLQDIRIYGWDPSNPDPKEGRQPSNYIRLMSTIDLSDLRLSGYNGTTVFVGEEIDVSGTLYDDEGAIITANIFNGLIRVNGWNGTSIVGSTVTGSATSGVYSLSYPIPSDYSLDTIYIKLSVTWSAVLQHYRPSSNLAPINVYWGFSIGSLRIYLPFNDTTIFIANGSTYLISEFDHQNMFIRGTLQDLDANPLINKQIIHFWNVVNGGFPVGQQQSVNSMGSFDIEYFFTGYENSTWEWRFFHILDNGTTLLSSYYVITFIWEVYDRTAPQFSNINPVELTTTKILPPISTTRITVTIFDPDNTTGSGFISVGLDNLSVIISIDTANYSMTQFSGTYNFYYDWDTSSPSDNMYRIIIYASDNAGNSNRTVNLDVYIDFRNPSGTISTPIVNNYVDVSSNGYVVISGTISDSDGTANSGIDTSSSFLSILYSSNGTSVFTVSFDQINLVGSVLSYSYSYDWLIFNSSSHIRISPYNKLEDWKIFINVFDLIGNSYQRELDVKLDNSSPTLTVSGEFNRIANPRPLIVDPTITSELILNVNFADTGGTGIAISTLTFRVFDNTTGPTHLYDIDFDDSRVDIAGNSATLTLNTNIEVGDYFIQIIIRDKTSNTGQVTARSFTIRYPISTTTTPVNTTTSETPDGGDLFGPVNLVEFIIFNLLALGGGIGIAALYERYKGTKR